MKEFLLRYQRQITLEGFGIKAQEQLAKAKVLVIGAGGLGCPVLQYLAAVGVGHLGIADFDKVSYSNLNRQILFGQADLDKSKVAIAEAKVKALNNLVQTTIYAKQWNQVLSIEHFPNYDIIVDATDNFASRYLINDGCVLLNKPLVFGAVSKFEGQVAVFNKEDVGVAINYRDLFPSPPKNDEVMNCAEGGVLGVLPGIIGVMQATEVIKLITGVGKSLANQLVTYNALTNDYYKIQLIKNPMALKTIPNTIEDYLKTNYEQLCQ
jgi:molybdopterin/thiamine biosynthesis adenylyltransferase